ncbi:MAG: hypothetical protein QNK37_17395 [Acidobacteriota bacterium]|nr:hypothetical protein [Acidobacteriota bacterium]
MNVAASRQTFFGTRAAQAEALICRREHTIEALARLNSETDRLSAAESHANEAHKNVMVDMERGIAAMRKQLDEDDRNRHHLNSRITEYDQQLQDSLHMLWARLKGLFGGKGAEALYIEREHLVKKQEALYFKQGRLREELAKAEKRYAMLLDPLRNLLFARESLAETREYQEAALARTDRDIQNLIADVIGNDPLEVLAHKLTRITDADSRKTRIHTILALREKLATERPTGRSRAQPKVSKMDLGQAVQDGFTHGTAFGSGLVDVKGSGTKRVRKSHTITDGNGNRRTQSYTTHVPVGFSGQVRATFDVTTTQWDPSPLGKAVAANMITRLQQGRCEVMESNSANYPEIKEVRELLGLE